MESEDGRAVSASEHSLPVGIAVIGAGPGGICMGIKLKEARLCL